MSLVDLRRPVTGSGRERQLSLVVSPAEVLEVRKFGEPTLAMRIHMVVFQEMGGLALFFG